jgi:hypothetical protein
MEPQTPSAGHTSKALVGGSGNAMAEQRSPLLRIPRELRDKIYRYILVTSRPLTYASGDVIKQIRFNLENFRCSLPERDYLDKIIDTRILQVNKQIFTESQEVLLKENAFKLMNVPRRPKLLKFAPEITTYITNIYDKETLDQVVALLVHHSGLRTLEMCFYITRPKYFHSDRSDNGLPGLCEILTPLRMVHVKKRLCFVIQVSSEDNDIIPSKDVEKFRKFLDDLKTDMLGAPI